MTAPISPGVLREAVDAARALGKPQPVHAPDGRIAFWAMPDGSISQDPKATVGPPAVAKPKPQAPPFGGALQPLNPDAQAAAQAALGAEGVGDTQVPQTPAEQAAAFEGVSLNGARAEPKPAPTLQQTIDAATKARDGVSYSEALRAQQANSAAGLAIWVNGVELTPVLNPDGTAKTYQGQVVYAFGGYGSSGKINGKDQSYTLNQMPPGFDKPSTANSVWDALNLGQSPYGLDAKIQPFDTFLIAGPGLAPGFGNFASDTSGAVIGPDDQHVSVGVSPYAGNLQDLQAGRTNMNARLAKGFSMMTIGEGLQAMQQMANDDPATYSSIINLLKRAGYDSSSSMTGGKALEGGPFTTETAMAFAHAMKDVAMQNAFEQRNGGTPATNLTSFLQQKVQARADAAAQAYEPMRRDYTDPADVAAAAHSAAQELLGRNLTAQEQAAFEANFHGQQVGQYNAADSAARAQAVASAEGTSSPGPTVTMPSPSGQAQQYLMGDQFSGDRATYLSMQYLDTIMQSLGVK